MVAHIRGLHEACGLRTLRIAESKADPSKLTATLSRLDHQRSLLARQLAVWTKKQQVTQLRIGVLDKEIAKIWRLMREIDAPSRAAGRHDGTQPPNSEQQADSGAAVARRGDVSIDY
jgi:hypothetical protein